MIEEKRIHRIPVDWAPSKIYKCPICQQSAYGKIHRDCFEAALISRLDRLVEALENLKTRRV